MRNIGLLIIAFVLSRESSRAQDPAGVAQAVSPGSAAQLKITDATPVSLRTKESISSTNAALGARIPFRVTEDVTVDDLVVIRRGAEAWGVITAVQPKASKGRAGSFEIAIQSVQLLTGQAAALRAEQHSQGAGKSLAERRLEVAQLGVSTFGLGLPLAPLLLKQKGEDAYLPINSKVMAYLNGEVLLDRSEVARVQPAVVPRTGPAIINILRMDYWSAYSPALYCGTIPLGWLPGGSYVKFQLPAGKYYLDSNSNQPFELTASEGEEIFLELKGQPHGLSIRWHFRPISYSEGEDDVLGLRSVSPKQLAAISTARVADLQSEPVKRHVNADF